MMKNTNGGRLTRNRRVLKKLIELRFQRLMMFRISFFGPTFVDGSLFAVQLLVFQAVYANVERIGSWGQGEMILYIGTFSLINAANMVIYFFGVNSIPGKIRSGEIDLYLTKPVSPLFRLTFEAVNPGSLPLVVLSIFIIGYGVKKGNIEITLMRVLSYLFWVSIMIILFYALEVIVRCLAFFVVSINEVTRIEEEGLSLCMQLPGIVFRGFYKILFCCILPYGIIATMPVQTLVGELNWGMAIQGIATVCIFVVIMIWLWKMGVKHYNSVSS